MSRDTRVKFGYLTESDMNDKLASGVLDAYDICYTKDTNLCYIINDELEPVVIRSKVYCYDSVDNAIAGINSNNDTYEGQIISVMYGDVYRAYMIQKSDLGWYLSPISRLASEVDFNELCNRPITYLNGTMTNPIIIGELSDGIYGVSGQYKLYTNSITTYITNSTDMYIKEGEFVTKYSAGKIEKYNINNELNPETYVTDKTLQDYATITYVREYIEGMQLVTQTNINAIVNNIITENIQDNINEVIDNKEATEEQITELFE